MRAPPSPQGIKKNTYKSYDTLVQLHAKVTTHLLLCYLSLSLSRRRRRPTHLHDALALLILSRPSEILR